MNKSKQAKHFSAQSTFVHPQHPQWLEQKSMVVHSSQIENAHKTSENPGLFVKKCVKIYAFDFEGL